VLREEPVLFCHLPPPPLLCLLLWNSCLLGFRSTGFGDLDCVLTLSIEERLLESPRPTLSEGFWVTRSPFTKLILAVRDVFLPVAGDGAVDLLCLVLAGGFPQARPTIPRLRNTFPVLGVSGALQACLVMFVMSFAMVSVFPSCGRQ